MKTRLQPRWLLSAILSVVAASSQPASAASCFSSCTRWAPCELDLTTTSTTLTDAALYGLRPAVTLERVDAAGQVLETRQLEAFYFERTGSSQGRFKARLNPTQQGTYRFSFSASVAMTSTEPPAPATFACGPRAPLAGGGVNQGFLRSNPGNTQNFVWDSGVRIFPWGQTYYQLVNLARKSLNNELAGQPPNDARWQNPVLTSRNSYRLNKVRFLLSPWRGDIRSSVNVDTKVFQKNPDGTLHRDKIDVQHWKAIDRVVQFLFDQGIVADLILFHDGDASNSPFGTPAQNRRYTRYAAARYAAFPNVIWSLANEYQLVTGDSPAGNGPWNDLGCLLRGGCGGYATGADPWIASGTFRRPLSIHNNINTTDATRPRNLSYPCFEFFTTGWATHVSLQTKEGGAAADVEAFNSVARNRRPADAQACAGLSSTTRLPVINDEYGYIGNFSSNSVTDRTRHRRGMWGVVTAGGFGSVGSSVGTSDAGCSDPHGSSGSCEPFLYTDTDNWTSSGERYADTRRMVDFFLNNQIPYWSMTPVTHSGPGTVHTLGVSGSTREFVLYSASGSTVAATNLATGGYTKTIFDPRTGASTMVPCCQLATSNANFTVSSSDDWVIWMRGATCQPTAPPCAP